MANAPKTLPTESSGTNKANKTTMPAYALRIELRGIQPAVWRRVTVPGSIELSELHEVIQLAMGWDNYHLHEFSIDGDRYGAPFDDSDDLGQDTPLIDEQKSTLTQALGGRRTFDYLYDFGDNWEHRVKVEKTLAPDSGLPHPLCTDGQNACPPEDVGGVPGYEYFLEAINDKAHEEHEDLLEWCGGDFNPIEFDLAEVNKRLSMIKFKPEKARAPAKTTKRKPRV